MSKSKIKQQKIKNIAHVESSYFSVVVSDSALRKFLKLNKQDSFAEFKVNDDYQYVGGGDSESLHTFVIRRGRK